MMKGFKLLTVSIDKDLYERIDEERWRRKLSRSAFVETILEEAMSTIEKEQEDDSGSVQYDHRDC